MMIFFEKKRSLEFYLNQLVAPFERGILYICFVNGAGGLNLKVLYEMDNARGSSVEFFIHFVGEWEEKETVHFHSN